MKAPDRCTARPGFQEASGPLIQLAPELVTRLSPGGRVVLSGLLEEQAEKVIAAYIAEGLTLKQSGVIEGWGTLVLGR